MAGEQGLRVGKVRSLGVVLSPRVSVELHRVDDAPLPIDALLDSGFSGSLSLPRSLIAELRLNRVGERYVVLADGSQILVDIHEGSVRFAGEWHDVDIHIGGPGALVDMRLMWGANISLDAVAEGDIEYRSLDLPRPRWP